MIIMTRTMAWNCGFESRFGYGCLSLVSVVCCQVEISASGWSLFQRSSTESGVSECDREAWIMRRPWYTRGCCVMERKTGLVLNPGLRSETPANNCLNHGMVVSNIHYTVLHQYTVELNLLDCGANISERNKVYFWEVTLDIFALFIK